MKKLSLFWPPAHRLPTSQRRQGSQQLSAPATRLHKHTQVTICVVELQQQGYYNASNHFVSSALKRRSYMEPAKKKINGCPVPVKRDSTKKNPFQVDVLKSCIFVPFDPKDQSWTSQECIDLGIDILQYFCLKLFLQVMV